MVSSASSKGDQSLILDYRTKAEVGDSLNSDTPQSLYLHLTRPIEQPLCFLIISSSPPLPHILTPMESTHKLCPCYYSTLLVYTPPGWLSARKHSHGNQTFPWSYLCLFSSHIQQFFGQVKVENLYTCVCIFHWLSAAGRVELFDTRMHTLAHS